MKKWMKRLAVMLAVILALNIVPRQTIAKTNPVTLEKAVITLKITEKSGKTKYPTAKIKVKKADGVKVKKITYQSANKKIATVNKKGKVTAKKRETRKSRLR